MNLLEVNNICKTYGSGETAVHALKKVSFSVPKGEYVAIVGESGSGKSTLLNMIGALDTPTSGKVVIGGKEIFSMNDNRLTVFRRRNIGFIFQAFNLIPELTVEQNIIFPVLLDYQKPDRKYLEELLTVLNLKERRNHLPSQLSGGQQQRVAIGRALITRPSLILADEPTGNLDTSGYALAIYNQDNRLNVGDKIKIGDTEIEIACIASEGVGSVSGAATMVCSEETYTQLTGEQDYALVSVVLEKNISETEVSKIRNLSSDYVFADNRAENSDVNGSYWVFRLAAYGFLAIISFITILNIMNSISMSVSARIKQYGAMRAVGMGNRQITKMITAEAITYAACGTIIGFVLGLLLHYLIYVKIIVTHFGGTWKVPVVPMEIIVLLVLVSCILAVYAPAKRIRNMAITATINEL